MAKVAKLICPRGTKNVMKVIANDGRTVTFSTVGEYIEPVWYPFYKLATNHPEWYGIGNMYKLDMKMTVQPV